jgi:pimeloyl-ACP methyl ester carboxylesterase
MRGAIAIVAGTTLLAMLPAPLSDHGPLAPAQHPCDLPGLDRPARCAVIQVAESADAAQGRRLGIRVIVVPSRAASQPDPVVVLAGGPGQGAAELAGPLAQRLSFLADARDLVLIDQRGTGASGRLACDPPPHAADLMGRIFDPGRLATCRDTLARNADLQRYTTDAAAADYEAVLDALGYGAFNVWAASYGTRLGLELARRMPQRVRTLTLEGAVPPSFAWPASGARDLDAALDGRIEDCERDADCRRTYSTFRRDVDAAFAGVARQPARVTVFDPHSQRTATVPFGATDLAYATRGLLYGADALKLPRMFRAAAAGRYDDFAQAYVSRARALGRELASGVFFGVYCAEDLPFVDRAAVRAASAGTRIGSYLLDEYARACEIWPRSPIRGDFRDRVGSAVPTLLMAGERDPVTPPWSAHDVASTLTRGRVVTFPAGGHGFDGLADPECKRALIRDFVSAADVDSISLACISRARVLPFE